MRGTPPPPPPDVPALLAAARAGDAQAFGVLVGLYRTELHQRVLALPGGGRVPGRSASDLTHDAMERVVARFADFRGDTEAEWRAWCLTILENAIASARRASIRKKRDARRQMPLSAAGDVALAAGGPSPSEAFSARERWRKVLGALQGLPERQRQAIRLHYLRERSVGDLALALGCSQAAAASLLQRGLAALRLHLDGTVPPDEATAAALDRALCDYLQQREREGPLSPADEAALLGRHPACAEALRDLLRWHGEVEARLREDATP